MSVDRAAVREYLGQGNSARTDGQIDSALAAERSDQARRCRVPADADVTPEADAVRDALEEALLRRVAVNLARRGLPLGMQMNEAGAARLTHNDPEVRRLEGPYRRTPLG